MSIVDLERNSVPVDLRVKIEHVMHDENLSWKDALVFLASKVVSPIGASKTRSAFFRARGGFTHHSRNLAASVVVGTAERGGEAAGTEAGGREGAADAI